MCDYLHNVAEPSNNLSSPSFLSKEYFSIKDNKYPFVIQLMCKWEETKFVFHNNILSTTTSNIC